MTCMSYLPPVRGREVVRRSWGRCMAHLSTKRISISFWVIIQGAPLVETYGPFNETTTKAYACELLCALDCALEAIAKAGVVHNNICPENIRIDASRHLVLVNFEVADLPGESSVQPDFDSDYSGTVGRNKERAYKALEVLLSWTRDSVVDALGFGMVLHWMVTSRHP